MRTTSHIRPAILKAVIPALLGALVVLGGGAGRAVHAEEAITVDGFLGGDSLADSSSNDPIVIEPDTTATLTVDVDNVGDETVDLSRVRLEGRALGVVFVAYDAAVDVTVAPDELIRLEIPLTFFDLGDQATGLLPATLIVYDDEGSQVATQRSTIDVRGDNMSIVGIFALTVIGLTVLGSVLLARQLATRSLPENRWHRALQFAPVGLGVGLIATIALAVLRIAAPHGMIWFPLLTVPTAIAFVLGYLAPGPLPADDPEQGSQEEDPLAGLRAPNPVPDDVLAIHADDDPHATLPARLPRPMTGSRA